MTAFQPIVVNKFNSNDTDLGNIYAVIGLFSLIPPLITSILTRFLKDRGIILFGLSLKLFGMFCFLGSNVPKWRVILGMIVIFKGALFFIGTCLSLYSKLVGPMLQSDQLGYLMSIFMGGAAIALLISSHVVMHFFGHTIFAIFALPALIATGVALSPFVWKHADMESPYIAGVLREAEKLKS